MTGINLWLFSLIQNSCCGLSVIVIYLLSNTSFKVSVFSLLLGIALAVANVFSLHTLLQAQAYGSFAYTLIIVSLSAVIPTFSGLLFFNESVSLMQYFGILFMVICIVLSPEKSEEKSQLNGKWLLYCALAFVFSGAVGVVQKTHQHSQIHRNEMAALLIGCFCFSTIFSGIGYSYQLRREQKEKQSVKKGGKTVLLLPIITGICFAFPHTINLFLSGKLPSVVLFPTVNLCPTILNMLYAMFVFKEKLTVKQWIGIGFGILSTVFVSGVLV